MSGSFVMPKALAFWVTPGGEKKGKDGKEEGFGARFGWGVFALALALCLANALPRPAALLAPESFLSIRYAHTLATTGLYATTPKGPEADVTPGPAPLYPSLLAGMTALLPPFGETLAACSTPREGCGRALRPVLFLNALLLALAAFTVARTMAKLGGSRAATLLACAYIAANPGLLEGIGVIGPDSLTALLGALAVFFLASAAGAAPDKAPWFRAGLSLGALGLMKPLFLPLAALMVGFLAIKGVMDMRRHAISALRPFIALTLALLVVNGAWGARNAGWFGAMTDGRASFELSAREALNSMTTPERRVAWFWWTPGAGPAFVQSRFSEESWRRLPAGAPDGFYQQGFGARAEARIAALQRSELMTRAVAQSQMGDLVLRDFLREPGAYLVTMPVVFYRGLWADGFLVVGFPALVLALAVAFRKKKNAVLLALTPGLWSLVVAPFLSPNLPRDQHAAVAALALATALLLERTLKPFLPKGK